MSRAAAILGLVLLAGCSLDPEVTGVWRSVEGTKVSWEVLEFEGRVELVLGQYGEAVAGMLRLYEDAPDFKENYLFTSCPCLYLDRASFDSGTLLFDVTPCGDDVEEWSGRFEWSEADGGEVLVGVLTAKNPDSTAAATGEFTVRYSGGKKLIKEDELDQECPAPTR